MPLSGSSWARCIWRAFFAGCCIVGLGSKGVDAVIVEAEQWNNVIVETSLHDPRTTADDAGCDPAGCHGGLTRDGDSTSIGSRWSCSPSLGPIGSSCSITFNLKQTLNLKGLRIALLSGNAEAEASDVTLEAVVNKNVVTTWTSNSSAPRGAFQNMLLPDKLNGRTIELRAVLDRWEWIGISEVEILVDSEHDEEMLKAAMEVAREGAINYRMRMHVFHAGRPYPQPSSQVTLVTQCSYDRLEAVLQQALRWGGDVSLAVLIPSAPAMTMARAMEAVETLCSQIDRAWKSRPSLSALSMDIALLDGVEADISRHDSCGPLYPVNTLRNLALIQARDDEFHPAKTIFLVDSDFAPSKTLLAELSTEEVQRRLLEGWETPRDVRLQVPNDPQAPQVPPVPQVLQVPETTPGKEQRATRAQALNSITSASTSVTGAASVGAQAGDRCGRTGDDTRRIVGAIVPCLEFVDGEKRLERDHQLVIPAIPRVAANLFIAGRVRGFHTHRVDASHGPTDFVRWAHEALNSTGGALAYSVAYFPRFEPYLVVAKEAIPLFDERFRGYGNNKVSHILALAMGGYPDPVTPADHDSGHTESLLANLEQVAEGVATVPEKKCRSDDTLSTRSNSGRKLAEFVVVRHGFIFHQPHQPSTGWEATYGEQKDELRLYQIRNLWLMFLEELRAGIPPVISESTDVLLRSLQLAHPPNARLMQMPGITMNETNVRNVFLLEREDIGALPALATHLLEVGGSSHR